MVRTFLMAMVVAIELLKVNGERLMIRQKSMEGDLLSFSICKTVLRGCPNWCGKAWRLGVEG